MLGWFSQFRKKISEAKIQKFWNFIQTTCIPRFFAPIGFCRGLFSIYWCWIVVRRHPDGGRRGRRDLADFDSCHLFLQFWMLNFWLFWMLLAATYMPIFKLYFCHFLISLVPGKFEIEIHFLGTSFVSSKSQTCDPNETIMKVNNE